MVGLGGRNLICGLPPSPPEEFGKGAVAGVAGPESANNAASTGAFVPMLALGIPTGPVTAVLIGALMLHGVSVGPLLVSEHPDVFWGYVARKACPMSTLTSPLRRRPWPRQHRLLSFCHAYHADTDCLEAILQSGARAKRIPLLDTCLLWAKRAHLAPAVSKH